MKWFTFYWRDGKREYFIGNDPAHALNMAGYGQGALGALDFWSPGKNQEYTWNKNSRGWDKQEPHP